MGKLGSLLALGVGGATVFYGYNLYTGDYRLYSRAVIPLLHKTWNAEHTHIFAVKAARHGVVPRIPPDDPQVKKLMKTSLLGIDLDNPVGLAAGFDKDGEAVAGLAHFGFGFLEVGSVTPQPQRGNLYPRVFRLIPDRAIINRYGFNSLGHEVMAANLERQAAAIADRHLVVGVNLGKNRDQTDPAADYIAGLRRFHALPTVSYFVVNVSSPNTPNLRAIQERAQLTELLERLLAEKTLLEKDNNKDSSSSPKKPLLLKIAPDLSEAQLADIAQVLLRFSRPSSSGGRLATIDGVIVGNTTVSRPASLRSPPEVIREEGGLSGPPLRELSTSVIGRLYRLTGGKVPIIGVGGIESGMDAYEKIAAGASAVQLYTSMAYAGPAVVRHVKEELALMLYYNGFASVAEAVGADHRPEVGPRKYPPEMEQEKQERQRQQQQQEKPLEKQN